ncbi:hypothetical protein Acsp04_18690 [Actinomadura sp. NBRC 104425]|nr:hypothetical protein Acsp04_18690 [Actinomadura sp. NBRC 104425]
MAAAAEYRDHLRSSREDEPTALTVTEIRKRYFCQWTLGSAKVMADGSRKPIDTAKVWREGVGQRSGHR